MDTRKALHVGNCAIGGMLATHDKRCIHKNDQLPQMHMQRSEEDANATHEALPRQQPAQVNRHGTLGTFLKTALRTQFVVIVLAHYLKLTREGPTSK